MTTVSFIAAIDEKNGLGKNNGLLCHLPADLKHFKNITMGKPVIMGRKTFDSIGKPLPGRLNIVLSRKTDSIPGVQLQHSLAEALTATQNEDEIMVIGGARIFEQFLPYATKMYLTIIHHTFSADVFFPTLDANTWVCIDEQFYPADDNNDYSMSFLIYQRKTLSVTL